MKLYLSIPKTSVPLSLYPPIVNTWEWSAVTTMRVSCSSVSSTAFLTARSSWTVSSRAFFAKESWWAWSILAPVGKYKKKTFLFGNHNAKSEIFENIRPIIGEQYSSIQNFYNQLLREFCDMLALKINIISFSKDNPDYVFDQICIHLQLLENSRHHPGTILRWPFQSFPLLWGKFDHCWHRHPVGMVGDCLRINL